MVSGLFYKLERGVLGLKHKKVELGLSTTPNPILALDLDLMNFLIAGSFG